MSLEAYHNGIGVRNVLFLSPSTPLQDADDKKKDWVTMMTLKRRQQAEENRIKVRHLHYLIFFPTQPVLS